MIGNRAAAEALTQIVSTYLGNAPRDGIYGDSDAVNAILDGDDLDQITEFQGRVKAELITRLAAGDAINDAVTDYDPEAIAKEILR